jgi:hypothetical protein
MYDRFMSEQATDAEIAARIAEAGKRAKAEAESAPRE